MSKIRETSGEMAICPVCGCKCNSVKHHAGRKHKDFDLSKFLQDNPGYRCLSDSYLADRQTNISKQRSNPEFEERRKLNQRNAMIDKWDNDTEYVKKMSKVFSDIRTDPDRHESRVEAAKKASATKLANPEYRTKNLAAISRQMKTSRKGIEYNGTKYRSKFEILAVKVFEELNIKFNYESTIVPYEYEGKRHNYIIDFEIPEYNLYIEVKSVHKVRDPIVRVKTQSAIDAGYDLKVVCTIDQLRKVLSEYIN